MQGRTADLVVPMEQEEHNQTQPVISNYNNFIIQQQNEGQNREEGSSYQGERKIISLQL